MKALSMQQFMTDLLADDTVAGAMLKAISRDRCQHVTRAFASRRLPLFIGWPLLDICREPVLLYCYHVYVASNAACPGLAMDPMGQRYQFTRDRLLSSVRCTAAHALSAGLTT
jgi:hypothetical protein